MQTTETFNAESDRPAAGAGAGPLGDGGSQTFPGPPRGAACLNSSQIVLLKGSNMGW